MFCQISSFVPFFILDSTYKCYHMIFIFLCLTSFNHRWFLSPSMLLSMALNNSFLCLNNIPLYICTSSSYLFLCWYTFGCFQVLAMVNSAAMNIWIHVSFWIMIFSGYMTRSGISESYVGLFFIFLRKPHTVLHSGYTSLYSHQQCRRAPFCSCLLQYLLFETFLMMPFWPVWGDTPLLIWFAFL